MWLFKGLSKQHSKMSTSEVPRGLINQGMTCYLNVVLQTLFMTDRFRDHVLRLRNEVTGRTPEEKLLQALADLFWRLQHERSAVSTTEVTNALNITNVYEQQDAAEYLQMILNKVPEPSEVFRGIKETSTKCSSCKHTYEEETDFLSIPLSINENGKCDVRYAWEENFGVHVMNGDDQLYCVTCESMRDMETINDIKKWPDILTLQLKRFEMKYIRNVLHYQKNECRVNIPSNIQMDSIKYESSPEYELYAIINHDGSFISGHYVTLIKDLSGNWYHFDDHTVTRIYHTSCQWMSDCSASAYLLMYRKVTKDDAPSGQDKETKDRATHTNEDRSCVTGSCGSPNPRKMLENLDSKRKSCLQSRNREEDPTTTKQKSMISPESCRQSSSAESVSSTKMLKRRLKDKFQYLNEEISPGERQKLNDVFIEQHITEKPDSHISDDRRIMRNNMFEGQHIRSVWMKGDAGTGKTVTVQKFILDWAEEKSNTHIDYIFPIPFQKLSIIRETVKKCSFMELLQQCFENTEHLKPDSDRIMLIFDGLNEFKLQITKKITNIHERASVSDLLTNLIMGNLLPNAQIWITSRPAAANQIPAKYIHRVTEIQGFDDQQKEEYFIKSISDQSMSGKVISHIQKSRRISSMCYLPDYCRIIAAIPEKMFSDDFPKTLTQMYSRLLLAQTELIRERRETIIALGRIAFHLLVNRNSLFSDEDLKKYKIRDESDLIRSSIIKKTEDKSKRKLLCFVNHRTQEFLAALYATEVINVNNPLQLRDLSSLKLDYGERCFTDNYLLQKAMENALEKQMDLFFCFLLGLTLESSQRALKDLLKQRERRSSSSQEAVKHIKTLIMKSSPENTDKYSLLFDALKELDEQYLIQEIKAQLKSGLKPSPDQISALMNSEEQQIQSQRSEDLRVMKGNQGLSDACITGRSDAAHSRTSDDMLTTVNDSERNKNPQSENPEQDDTSTKQLKPSMINPESSTQSPSTEMFKWRLKEEFQYLNEKPGERQKLNDVFIKPHITEEPDSHISDKRPITCKNMFNIRSVLMKGDAGTGKTVTVQKFILDWAEEKSNTHIDYIFPIPFQKLNIIRETVKKCSFMELLQQCFENTEYLKLHDSDKIMMIFDGLNEFKHPLENAKKITDINDPASVSDLLLNLIMGNLLPNAQIWITSRPAAANQIPVRFIDRVTEIQGFDDQQKEEYFRKSISDQSMIEKVISHIQKSPRISSMCYLPDYCRIIAAIPEKMFSDDFPKTLTQMYSRLLLAQTELIRERRETIIALGRIAFHLLVNRNSLFSDEDLKKCGIKDESDLIHSSIIKKTEDKSTCKSFCFVNHRTQEFLAALYATEVINVNNPLQLRDLSGLKLEFGEESFTDYSVLENVMENTLERQMDLFFCFLLGLTLESSQRALKDLLKQRERRFSSSQDTVQHIKTLIMNSSSENTDKYSLLFDALKELDEQYLIQEIKSQLKSGLRLSPAQFSALMFVLMNSEEQLDEIKSYRSEGHDLILRPVIKSSGEHELYQCGIGVKACADLSSALRSNPSYLRELNLSGNALGDSGVKLLADLQCKLEKLELRSCFINEEGCAVLSSALRSNSSHLRELDLSENLLGDSGVKQLSDLLEDDQFKLKKLGLRSCHISDRGCADLSSALRSNLSHLKELDLSGNDITYSGVKQLSDLLEDPQCKLEKLGLCSFHINEEACADLSSALKSNLSHLKELDLSENEITDSGIEKLSPLLEDLQCKLKKLGLRSCHISERACAVLSSALRLNPSHLRELDLSENVITDSGVKHFTDLLKHPECKLEKLWLRSCFINVEGCAVLSSALRSNPSHLRELDLSDNDITDSGVKQLSDLLKHRQCELEKLELRSCRINVEGCAVLSSALSSNPSHLRELDLSKNYFTDSGVKQLSDLLENSQFKLQKLWLRSCRIKQEGCAVLSSALGSNPSHLRELDLSENYFTDSGVKQLLSLLEDPLCELEKLGLRSCYISEGSCTDLSSALRSKLSPLKELDLSDNNITYSGVKQLSDLLKNPQCKLEKLWLKLKIINHSHFVSQRSIKTRANRRVTYTGLETSFEKLNIDD